MSLPYPGSYGVVFLFSLGGFQHYFKLFGLKQQDLTMVTALKLCVGGLDLTSSITSFLNGLNEAQINTSGTMNLCLDLSLSDPGRRITEKFLGFPHTGSQKQIIRAKISLSIIM